MRSQKWSEMASLLNSRDCGCVNNKAAEPFQNFYKFFESIPQIEEKFYIAQSMIDVQNSDLSVATLILTA